MYPVRVRDIADLLVWAKTNPIRPPKAICNHPDATSAWLESIDLVWQLRRRPNALLRTVDGICEPDAPVRVNDNVIGRVEGSIVEGCDEQFS